MVVMVATLDIAPLRELPLQKSSGMGTNFQGISVLPEHLHVQSAIGMSHTCLCLPVMAGTHLPTPEGWKAELAWVAGCVVIQFTRMKAVTHLTTNGAQCSATALIETNAFPLH